MELNLSPEEIRVLGVLMEKEATTPEYYPLTLNATTNACNQKSSRDPVMALTQNQVEGAFKKLLGRGLTLYRGETGSRVSKFEHLFTSTFHLDEKQKTVLCLLMLRGPQTAGEIKSRCGRLHEFGSVPEVEQTLQSLIDREHQALVQKLPKQPGRKENRFYHLLSGEVENLPEPSTNIVPNMNSLPPIDEKSLTPEDYALLEDKVNKLTTQLTALRSEFETFKKQFD